jgi:hypothetical protein
VTADHLAVLADLLDAGLNLHCCPAFSSTAPGSGADHARPGPRSLSVLRIEADRPGSCPGPTPESGVDFSADFPCACRADYL